MAAYREALKERTRERVPLDWAMTQNNLGNALSMLGRARERDGEARRGGRRLSRGAEGTNARARAARLGPDPEQSGQCAFDPWGAGERDGELEEAVAAYREALKECTRERVPLDWAMTQNNLGIALCEPWGAGERDGEAGRGSRRLSRGAEGIDPRARAARLGHDPDQSGQCAPILGERESGTAKLEEAIAAYREALKELTRERVPLDWAMTQNNLGTALSSLGERESGTAS